MRRTLIVMALLAGMVVVPATRGLTSQARPADFNGDGISDLAIGAPFEDPGAVDEAGAVHVLYGYSNGLRSLGDQFLTQDTPGVPGDLQAHSNFGLALGAGDFNGDGYSDLAIGAPGENVGSIAGAGAVIVLYGSAAGLTDDGAKVWTQATPGVAGTGAEHNASFGLPLAAGDLDGDGRADLAIGAPTQTVGTATRAGAVNVLYGTGHGLSANHSQFWTQDSTGVRETSESDDFFGFSLAVGNFGKSSPADLAIGVPHESDGSVANAGAVNVLYGSSSGLIASGNQLWSQDSTSVKGSPETGDEFGYSLTAANFGKSVQADLAVGVRSDRVGTTADAGGVNVLYGSRRGLTAAGNQLWTRGSKGVKGPVTTDEFGEAVGAGNFGKSSQADLAIGAEGEDVGSAIEAGAVNVLYGSPAGLTASGNQLWTQNSPGVRDTAEAGDNFGIAVAGANFGRSSQADLAIGAYGENVGSNTRAGAVHVLYGSATGLTASGNQFWTEGSSGVAGPGPAPFTGFGCTLPGSACHD